MAADYQLTPRWGYDEGGTAMFQGTVLAPDRYLNAAIQELPLYADFWTNFVSNSVNGIQITQAGGGKHWHLPYLKDESPTVTPLTSETKVGVGLSEGVGEISGTLHEYGTAEAVEGFADYVSAQNLVNLSGAQLFRHAMMSRNAIIGSSICCGSNFQGAEEINVIINSTGTTQVVGSTSLTGSATHIKPANVRALYDYLSRTGVQPYDSGLYVWVGPPGAFSAIKAQTEVYQSAAQLGFSDLYTTGKLMTYGGFMFVEEPGAVRQTGFGVGTNVKASDIGSSFVLAKNCLYGGDNFERSDLIKYYPDDQNDFGRRIKVGWYGLGGYKAPFLAGTNSRIWRVFSQHGN
ncbi:MAG: hypothetical protein R6X33_11095 [Candidatus Brocadiia bacterium]